VSRGKICCVGAAFDFEVGARSQAPKLVQKAGMEWLYRLFLEPKRMWSRYLVYSPIALIKAYKIISTVMIKK
jgi:N-acetylglucosaminyldiphosphoundecaprenol N-acetyl-beta-D-mannosaminyltransferase